MNAMIDFRRDGEDSFQLVDRASGTVAADMPSVEASAEDNKQQPGVAQAYALPPLPNIPSRKFFRH
jgi:hypothetical protein